jgi:hypothetical protein
MSKTWVTFGFFGGSVFYLDEEMWKEMGERWGEYSPFFGYRPLYKVRITPK